MIDYKHDKALEKRRGTEAEVMLSTFERLQREAYELGLKVYQPSHSLLKTISVNVCNEDLSDADFRRFVCNSLVGAV